MKKRITLALSLVFVTVFQLSAVAISPTEPMDTINAKVEVQRALAGISDVAVTGAQREKVYTLTTAAQYSKAVLHRIDGGWNQVGLISTATVTRSGSSATEILKLKIVV